MALPVDVVGRLAGGLSSVVVVGRLAGEPSVDDAEGLADESSVDVVMGLVGELASAGGLSE